jgi:asparagine synthetase B (glutamine-hydrolysing)
MASASGATASSRAGMFAITIWDSRLERLILARDRFGEKPPYTIRPKF